MDEKMQKLREKLNQTLSQFINENFNGDFDAIHIDGHICFKYKEDNNIVYCPRPFEIKKNK